MRGESGGEPAQNESRRRRGWRILLLGAFVLIGGGVILSGTELGGSLGQQIKPFVSAQIATFPTDLPPLAAVGTGLALTLLAGLLVLSARRRKARRKVAVEAPTTTFQTLGGREQLFEVLARRLAEHSESGRQLALHLVDMDRFHVLNTELGEAEGDAFLRGAADSLLALVGNREHVARIGDDEFAVIQPETGGARHAEIYARRIHDALAPVCAQVPKHVRPGTSIGVAVYPEHGEVPSGLFRSASLALRAAKEQGGNVFRVYSRSMELRTDERVKMERAIRDGLDNGRFELHFQPRYDLGSTRLTGFEALLRLNDPELGKILPATFLPAAEESGLVQPLGEWVIREAASIAAEWPHNLHLAVNVSAPELRQGQIAATILKTLAGANVEISRLEVEISEAVLSEGFEGIRDQVRQLEEAGATIVLDDFGAGSSNLAALSRAGCSAVKLDQSFVVGIGREPLAEKLVRALIGTAKSFGLTVMAEGVETVEQAHFLILNGCRNVQGYLFGRPVPADEIAPVIAKDLRNMLAGRAAKQARAPAGNADQSRSMAASRMSR